MVDGRGNAVTTKAISILSLIACVMLSACQQESEAKPNSRSGPRIDVVTEKQVEQFKNEFLEAGNIARKRGWDVGKPVIPADPDLLIQRGLHICLILDENKGKASAIKKVLYSTDMSKRDWDTTVVIARASASSLCVSYRKRVEKWFDSL